MAFSLGIGLLILFYAHITRTSKIGHTYIPRPTKRSPSSEEISEEPGYMPPEEEVKMDAKS